MSSLDSSTNGGLTYLHPFSETLLHFFRSLQIWKLRSNGSSGSLVDQELLLGRLAMTPCEVNDDR